METNYCISTINPGFTSHINLSFITNFISGKKAQCRYISFPVQASLLPRVGGIQDGVTKKCYEVSNLWNSNKKRTYKGTDG